MSPRLALAALLLSGAALALPESRPKPEASLRGVHLTAWAAGSPAARRRFIREMKGAGLNMVVIALKETDGTSFVPGVPLSREIGAYAKAIPDLPEALKDFRDAGIYTSGRVVLFKDDRLARKRPVLAVKRPDGSVWANDKGTAWVDPYRREVWDYNLDIAERAAHAGFDEIQFDYIRFPSDGDTANARYAVAQHSPKTAGKALREFLAHARRRLPARVKLSVCLFGLTTTVDDGMGIGQRLGDLGLGADYISPMMYPSHYRKGEYGIKNPNREPYKTIRLGLTDAAGRLGAEARRLRPYLQDFSLGVRYRPEQVRAQILAAARSGVTSWVLWNPQNRYTWSAVPRAEALELARKSCGR